MADEEPLSREEFIRRYLQQRALQEQSMREAGMSEMDIMNWKQRTGRPESDVYPVPTAARRPGAVDAALAELQRKRAGVGSWQR